jgi:ATP-dependent Zn protease
VISRGNMGGYVQSGSENKGMYSRRDLLDKIEAALGGRAAEMLYYGEDGITTSASADLKHATELARWMVVELGMDSEFGLAVDSQEGMSREVREKVNAILNEQLQRALAVLRENRAAIDRLVKKLIAKNYLSGEEAAAVVKE